MQDAPKPAKRIVPSLQPTNRPSLTAPQLDKANVLVMAPVDGMLEQALSILQSELVRFQMKTKQLNKSLTLAEARVLTGYIKALVELSKESREREKQAKFDDMGTLELLRHLMGSLPPDELAAFKAEFSKLEAKQP